MQVDQDEVRMVTREKGENFAEQLGAVYMEVSAKTGQGVRDTFLKTVEEITSEKRAQVEKGELKKDKSQEEEVLGMGWKGVSEEGSPIAIDVHTLQDE